MDYEQDHGKSCPKCGHSPTHYRDCINLFCENGQIDENEDDTINFMPGESYRECPECSGQTIEAWCPKCSYDISKHKTILELTD